MFMWVPVVLSACAFGGLAYVVFDLMMRERTYDPQLGRFEGARRAKLRGQSAVYRWFEPWVDELKLRFSQTSSVSAALSKDLIAAGDATPWMPEEYLAVAQIEGILWGVFCSGLSFFVGGLPLAAAVGAGVYLGYGILKRRMVKSRAIRRQIRLKRRFAAIVDLMALMMEVGGSFSDGLQVAADESRGHPLGDELAIVHKEISMNRVRKRVLQDFAARTQDDDIGEVIMSVVEGEELGTPLADIFRTQAAQMRQKRSQWAEKAAEEAQVALVFPAVLVMLACLITVAAPFILEAVYNPGGY